MARIAVVDDEENLRETLSYALRQDGHELSCFPDGEQAWRAFQKDPPDLMILDIMMPRMDGLELCRRIRGRNEEIPLIFLSSRDEEFDRILGLEIGGDDYLCKPYSLRELRTRVKALLRRCGLTTEPPPAGEGALKISDESYRAWWKGELLPLSISEFRILRDLSNHRDAVRTREQLILAAFPEDSFVSGRSADSHIKRLRKKIHTVDASFDGIETVYGLGYRLRGGL
jgi:DNA-binding response OmpR family regulator